jgi:hypothetical protein
MRAIHLNHGLNEFLDDFEGIWAESHVSANRNGIGCSLVSKRKQKIREFLETEQAI